ncbi:MAG: arginine--tRNA ligase, partial [Chitinophagaceae bacterium]
TGPFIQYSYARTKSILRRAQPSGVGTGSDLLPLEKALIVEFEKYPSVIAQACVEMNPSAIATYVFKLAQTYNSFVTVLKVLTAETEEKKELRLQLSQMTVNIISSALHMLGISAPEKM